MPVLQTSIRDSRLKSLAVTCYQRSQQREMNEYFITSGCRTGAGKRTPVSHLGRDHEWHVVNSQIFESQQQRRRSSRAHNVAHNGTINGKEARDGKFQSRSNIAAVQVPEAVISSGWQAAAH
jgi:hypothetical protein